MEYNLPAKVVRDHAIEQTTGILVTNVNSPTYTESKHIDEGFEIRREVLENDFILKIGEKRVENLQDYLTVLKNNVGRDLKLTMLSGDNNIYYTFVEVTELNFSE